MHLIPELIVHDVSRALVFYRDQLGFSVIATAPETGDPLWALLRQDTAEIMLQAHDAVRDELPHIWRQACGGTLLLMLKFASPALVRQASARLSTVGCLTTPARNTAYGTLEAIGRDHDGYTLILSSELEA